MVRDCPTQWGSPDPSRNPFHHRPFSTSLQNHGGRSASPLRHRIYVHPHSSASFQANALTQFAINNHQYAADSKQQEKMLNRSSPSTFLAVLALLSFALPAAMALVPYTPRSLLDMMLSSDVDPFKILEHSPLSSTPFPRGAAPEDGIALARADWRETPSEHQISLDVPGMRKEDLKIEVIENRVVSVSGERKKEEEVKEEQWHSVERTVGKFWRQFRLPANADMEHVKARLEDGVLRIKVPKLSEVHKKKEPKVISITSDDKPSAEADVKPRQEL